MFGGKLYIYKYIYIYIKWLVYELRNSLGFLVEAIQNNITPFLD